MNRNRIEVNQNSNLEEVAEMLVFNWASLFKDRPISTKGIQAFKNSLSYSLFSSGMGLGNCKILASQVIEHWVKENKDHLWEMKRLENLESAVCNCLTVAISRFVK